MKLTFLGANRQVTGSRHFLEAGGLRILIDCGLFQERQFQDRNWAASPVDPKSLDVMLLTHAHLDHCGLIPKLVRDGFSKPIYATAPSIELARLVMLDSAKIQEEDAAFKAARHQAEGRTDPSPPLPLYTVGDVERALPLFRPVKYRQPLVLNSQVSVIYHDAGHILGSASLEVIVQENGSTRRVVYSGDQGMRDTPLILDPEYLTDAQAVVMESTYGDRDHDLSVPIQDQLAKVINETVQRGGNIVIPAFAIERAQELLYYLSHLMSQNRIPHLLSFVDSPMAVNAIDIFEHHPEYLDQETLQRMKQVASPFHFPGLTLSRTTAQSKAINHLTGSCIILAGSGMCTGGRIKHHLVHNISRPQSTVLFVGYQAAGTLGREILDGGKEVRIQGVNWPVRAKVAKIDGLSAHADRSTLLRWAGAFKTSPRFFLTHGEEAASLALAEQMRQKLGCEVQVPQYLEAVTVD